MLELEQRLTALVQKVSPDDKSEAGPQQFIFIDEETAQKLQAYGCAASYHKTAYSSVPNPEFPFAVLVPKVALQKGKFDPDFAEPDTLAEWVMSVKELDSLMKKKRV